MPVKIAVKDKNVMSQAQFRKLREGKFTFLCAEKGSHLIDSIEFLAMFTSKLTIKDITLVTMIHVQKGDEEIVTVNKATAKKLNLIKD